MSEYLRFSTNIPDIISLKFSEGLPCKSKVNDEDQVMFTLANERRMYLSPYTAKLITDQSIRKAQPFSICKREHREGAVKSIRWEVKRLDEPQPETDPSCGSRSSKYRSDKTTIKWYRERQ